MPSNYAFILQKLLESSEDDNGGRDFGGLGLTKKDIFARLSRPNTFDGGTKEIWLDKNTGGVCLSISSKAMSITGIEDRRYWNHIPSDESRFKTVAYLVQIWWFEVSGQLDFKFPAGTYSLFFRLQLGRSSKRFGRRICYLEHIHGWDIRPIRFQLTTSDGQHSASQCYLDNPGCWVMYHAGDFVVRDPDELTRIKFSATQIDCTHNKGGISLDSVFIYPKGLAPLEEA